MPIKIDWIIPNCLVGVTIIQRYERQDLHVYNEWMTEALLTIPKNYKLCILFNAEDMHGIGFTPSEVLRLGTFYQDPRVAIILAYGVPRGILPMANVMSSVVGMVTRTHIELLSTEVQALSRLENLRPDIDLPETIMRH